MENNFIPDTILSKAIDMSPIGVFGYAFDYQNTIALLDFCKDKQIAILEGDALELKKKNFHIHMKIGS